MNCLFIEFRYRIFKYHRPFYFGFQFMEERVRLYSKEVNFGNFVKATCMFRLVYTYIDK